MAYTDLPIGGIMIAVFVAGFFIHRMGQKEESVVATTEARDPEDPLEEPHFHLPLTMSTDAGMNAWWLRRFHQRPGYEAEYLYDLEDDGVLVVTLPLPRRVTRIEIQYESPVPVPLKNVTIDTPEDAGRPEWTGAWIPRRGSQCLQLDFDGVTPLDAVRVEPAGAARPLECRLWLNKRGNPDAAHLEAADRAERQGRLEDTMFHYLAYQELCPDNPVPAIRLAFLHRHREQAALAEIQALRAIAGKRAEFGANICRELALAREWWLTEEKLAALREEAAAWELEGHHGLVTLRSERHFLTGPGDFLRERGVAAIMVRRRAAARKFSNVTFPMVTGWGGLIHTAARVRRLGDRVDVIGDDKFTVGSAQDDNPFVAVARRSVGTWILPDLEPGDVVEYTYDKVQLGQRRPFVLANVADPDNPTLHGRVTCTAPPEKDMVCAMSNTGPGCETGEDPDTGWRRISLVRERIVPRRSHSAPHQRTSMNPVVAFAGRAGGWDAVGAELLGHYYEALDAAGEIPARLRDVYADGGTAAEKLARAFYWIRDHVKYASVASHHEVLMSPERADFVLESGMGDCKDVSYLLALVCRDLGVPWEFALTSTENGIVIADLPADQFDHVILRAEVDGEWLYLDASNSGSVFGSPPPAMQGFAVLCGREPYDLVTVPDASVERNRLTIRQTLAGLEDDWLRGTVEARLEGYPARFVDETWKMHSLNAVDPDRVADEAVGFVAPRFGVESVERRRDTSGGDVLDFTATGRHARLIDLDGSRVASFGFAAPALYVDENTGRRYRERFVFPFRMTVAYELVAADDLRKRLRAVSRVEDLATAVCSIREQRGGSGEAVVLRREIVLRQREVAGDDLEQLPELLNRLGAATRVVVALES